MNSTKRNSIWDRINDLLGLGDNDYEDVEELLLRVLRNAVEIIDEKNVEIAQLTIDLAQRDETIRRLEEIIQERNEELLDLHAKTNGFDAPDKPYRCVQCGKTWTMRESPGALCPECGGATVPRV